MLEKYKNDYNEFYSIMKNAINTSKISHAYMFEIDENLDIDEFEKDICKILINSDDKDINLLIDNENYPNIKKVKADGLWIKKEQIQEVQSDFRKESYDNNLKIYIIEDASKLNKSSGNTLLKFLEEPERNIVAVLLTKNKYSVIKTIMSRCINISLIKKSFIEISEDDISYKAVELIEVYKAQALPYLYELILKAELERKELYEMFENMQKIYNDFLHINNNIKAEYNYFSKNKIANIKFDNNNDLIIKKINAIQKNSEYMKNNVNIKTILDKIIIDVYGGE